MVPPIPTQIVLLTKCPLDAQSVRGRDGLRHGSSKALSQHVRIGLCGTVLALAGLWPSERRGNVGAGSRTVFIECRSCVRACGRGWGQQEDGTTRRLYMGLWAYSLRCRQSTRLP